MGGAAPAGGKTGTMPNLGVGASKAVAPSMKPPSIPGTPIKAMAGGGAKGMLSQIGQGLKKATNTISGAFKKAASDSTIDELLKLGAVTEDQAHAALHRLETMEATKATPQQVGRYATIGAVAGPAISMAVNAIKGKGLVDPVKNLAFGRTRALLSESAKGALAGGAIPLARQHFDRQAERKVLHQFVNEGGIKEGAQLSKKLLKDKPPGLPKVKEAFHRVARGLDEKSRDSLVQIFKEELGDAEEKKAFATSMYSGPLSGGSFPMVSAQPGFKMPDLRKVIQGDPQQIIEKIGGVATTPGGVLASSLRVGKTPGVMPGAGSIATIAKPQGFGKPMAGAIRSGYLSGIRALRRPYARVQPDGRELL